jgi:hypothetical protein
VGVRRPIQFGFRFTVELIERRMASHTTLELGLKGEANMEKQLTIAAYWVGIASTVVALITRALAMFGIVALAAASSPGRSPISYRTFLEGAELFFLMAIAGSVLIWARSNKT